MVDVEPTSKFEGQELGGEWFNALESMRCCKVSVKEETPADGAGQLLTALAVG